MKINRQGCTRIVLIFRYKVVKIPNFFHWHLFLHGLLANIKECNVWRLNSGRFATGKEHLLCPVLWASWGGWMLVMARAETHNWDEWENLVQEGDCEEHKKFFPGDDKMLNYGVYEGRLVKIDYGQIDENNNQKQ